MKLSAQEQSQARKQLVSSLQPGTITEAKIILKFSQAAARLLEDGKAKREPVGRDAVTAMFKTAGNGQVEVAYHARFEEPVHLHRETLLPLVSAMMVSPYRNAGETVRVNVDATADSIIVDLPFMVPYEFTKNPLVNAVFEAAGGRSMFLTAENKTRMFVRADAPK